ncbi:hypothetical protein ASG40_15490 [Methylobacterium sp. Leaf399]|uniref:TadE/TadG family type IV pilus assembly protein n=1 Tax=Methylobacterium sp. Leaf399 TaxID=1736364 RepID=UPI0006FEDDD7|nr:TadE/TadG family type IV pilus assembly protein [Methylobacterium sp. Leaf399]KQT19062.1 hypothetical protein ASG40_15490 [Methylobacterium sp. Leaf399]
MSEVVTLTATTPLEGPSRGEHGRVVSRFAGDAGGATAIEFAFVVFPLLTLLLLVLEVGLVYWTGAVLDNGVQATARTFYTDTGASAASMVDTVRTGICERASGLINCDRLKVDLSYYADFSAVTAPSPVDPATKTWRTGFGTAHGCTEDSRIVVVRAALAQQSVHNAIAGLATFSDGSRLIQSTMVVTLGRRSTGLTGC